MWEQLGVPAESVFSFLSECDFLALFHPRVLDLYTRAYTDLTGRTPPATVASSRVHGVCGHVGVYLSCLCGLWFFEKHPRAFHHVYATGTAETAIDEHAKKMSSPPGSLSATMAVPRSSAPIGRSSSTAAAASSRPTSSGAWRFAPPKAPAMHMDPYKSSAVKRGPTTRGPADPAQASRVFAIQKPPSW